MPISATFHSSRSLGRSRLVSTAQAPGTARQRGYTLLEMVVVLAIMALVAGVAAVRVVSLIDSWRIHSQLADIDQQFQHLPVLARQWGRTIELPPPKSAQANGADTNGADTNSADTTGANTTGANTTGANTIAADSNSAGANGAPDEAQAAANALELPPDWLVRFDRRLVVRASGFCEGAHIVLQKGAHTYPRVVTAPFCRLESAGDAQ